MMTTQHTLQWNCFGYNTHQLELNMLVNNYSPLIINIQETKFNINFQPKYNHYIPYFKNHNSQTIAHGGVLTFVHETITSCEIPLVTSLQAVAVKVSYPFEHVICNIYLPGSQNITESDLVNLINQLGTTYIIQGDFNGHNPLWGSDHLDSRGKLFEKIINDYNLCLLNEGNPTHFSLQHRTFSCIDLTITSPSIAACFEWSVSDDLHGSDHFPIFLTLLSNCFDKSRRQKWLIKKADWSLFQESLFFHDDLTNSCN